MSRIGKNPVTITAGVDVNVTGTTITVKGKLGELKQEFDPAITITVADGKVTLARATELNDHKAKHGLYRSLINNMIVGVSEGYKTEQEMVGVGYRATVTGQLLELVLGFSHNVVFAIPKEVKVEATSERGKNPVITLTSHDKQLIGQVAAKIRALRPPEPYKGKGIRFKGEQVRRKAGKSASS